MTLIVLNQWLFSSNLISPSDPSYIYLNQYFRTSHDLSLYMKSYPYTLLEFVDIDSHNDNVFTSKQAIFRIKPGLRVWDDIPITTVNMWASARSENLSFLVEPVIVNEPYGPDLLGTDYVRSGIGWRIASSFIRYKNDLISLQLGLSPVWWGQSFNRSIIHTNSAPAYDHVDLRLYSGRFQLELLTGQLDSELLNGKRIKRNIAGHRLTFLSKNGKLLVGLGEQIIYTGQNRGIELHYLNPAVPYFFAAIKEDEEISAGADNDNSIIFAVIRYVIKPHLSVFSEFIVDEFHIDDDNSQDGLGYKIGADGAFDIAGKPITWALEWASIDSWTYIHPGQFTSWQNCDHALGFLYGPDLRSLYVQADMWISKTLLFNVEADWLEKGSNTLLTDWGNRGNKGDSFPKPPITHHTLLNTSLSWYWKYGIIEAGWSNYDFPNKIAFTNQQTKNDGSFFLKLQLFYEFGFDL